MKCDFILTEYVRPLPVSPHTSCSCWPLLISHQSLTLLKIQSAGGCGDSRQQRGVHRNVSDPGRGNPEGRDLPEGTSCE